MTEQLITAQQLVNKVFTKEVRGVSYEYYLTGPIQEPDEYIELCNILRSAGPQDEVIIRINSRGGFVSSERMIVNAIRESEAVVKAFIEYDCMSAATGVFLAAHEHGWGEHIQFMAHCSWWSSLGKNPDIKSHTEFAIRQMEKEIEATYAGLLTPEEIKQCNDGKEFWFGAEELEERIHNFYEYRSKLYQEQNESEGVLEQPKSLEDMIESAVMKAFENQKQEVVVDYSNPPNFDIKPFQGETVDGNTCITPCSIDVEIKEFKFNEDVSN